MKNQYDILIVKDLSRFSRRNSYGLVELETLRDVGIRIISIGDNIDYPTNEDWMRIQIYFFMNEMPVTDTSKKVKSVINRRQKDGKWICAVPYGYRLLSGKSGAFEVDEPAAEVVHKIFELYNDGWGYKRISNWLTDEGIPTPRMRENAYRQSRGEDVKREAKPHGASSPCRAFWTTIFTSALYASASIHARKLTAKMLSLMSLTK